MTSLDGNNLFSKFHGRAPVGTAELEQFRQEVGFDLPRDYVEFLQQSDGGEGWIGPNAYVIFYRLTELAEWIKVYQFDEFARGFFIFGSDGGGEAYAFDIRTSAMPIVMFPFIGLDPDVVDVMAPTFTQFLEVLASLDD
jgi:SMI1 / KNR4 family (SUKH-1)